MYNYLSISKVIYEIRVFVIKLSFCCLSCIYRSDQLEAVWAVLMSLFKSVCFIKNIKLKDKSAIIDKFRGVFDRVDANTLQVINIQEGLCHKKTRINQYIS
jgi:hypothetical protein